MVSIYDDTLEGPDPSIFPITPLTVIYDTDLIGTVRDHAQELEIFRTE
jgi:hypothetical protein